MNVLERDVARAIDAYLDTLGLKNLAQRDHGGRFKRRTTGVGTPDRWGVLPGGRHWAIEIKRPDARPRPNEAKQNAVLDYLRSQGALVIVARDVADVHAVLNPQTLQEHAWADPRRPAPNASRIYDPDRDEVAGR